MSATTISPGTVTRPPSAPRPRWTASTSSAPASLQRPGLPATVTAYKNLAREERDFRSLKADDLDLRPIHHRLEDRVRGHMLICMLAACFTWHLRHTWAPLTFADE
jgi:hypothetical protein